MGFSIRITWCSQWWSIFLTTVAWRFIDFQGHNLRLSSHSDCCHLMRSHDKTQIYLLPSSQSLAVCCSTQPSESCTREQNMWAIILFKFVLFNSIHLYIHKWMIINFTIRHIPHKYWDEKKAELTKANNLALCQAWKKSEFRKTLKYCRISLFEKKNLFTIETMG